MENKNQENQNQQVRVAAPERSLLDRFESDWHWARHNPAVKKAIITHLKASVNTQTPASEEQDAFKCITQHRIHSNKIRKKIHNFARLLGLQSVSVGKYPYRDHLELKTPVGLNLDEKIESALAMDEDALNKKLSQLGQEHARRGHGPSGKKKRSDRFERYISYKSCDECGCDDYSSTLGYARDGSILCVDCWESDPVLSAYKWEDLESCFY